MSTEPAPERLPEEEDFRTARELLARGEFGPAAERLEARRAAHPEDAATLALLGAAWGGAGRLAEGIDVATRATELRPGFAYAHFVRASLLLNAGHLDPALDAARRAAELDAQDADLHALQADVLTRLGRDEEAHRSVRRALTLDHEHITAINLEIEIGRRLGQPRFDAEDTLGGALERNPDNPETHANLGAHHLAANQPGAALGHFREALRRAPGHPEAARGVLAALARRSGVRGASLRGLVHLAGAGFPLRLALLLGSWLALDAFARLDPSGVGLLVAILAVGVLEIVAIAAWIPDALSEVLYSRDVDGRLALPAASLRRAHAVQAVFGFGVFLAVFAIPSARGDLAVLAASAAWLALPLAQAMLPTEHRAPVAAPLLAGALALFALQIIVAAGIAPLGTRTAATLFAAVIVATPFVCRRRPGSHVSPPSPPPSN
ncbi:MAG: hypothetical protein R3F20_06800 [Planctomycetota bacterium]